MSGTYGPLFQTAGEAQNVDPTLLAAINQVESAGNPGAVSSAGAQGNMQLMPATAASLGVKNPNDPAQAIPGAAALMNQNLNATKGDVPAAVAMYFAGPNRAEWGPKTHAYVTKVADAYQQLKAAPMANTPLTLDDLAGASGLSGAAPAAAPQAQSPLTLDDLQSATVAPSEPGKASAALSPTAAAAHPIANAVINTANAIVNNPIAQGIARGAHVVLDAPAEALAAGATKLGIPQGLQTLMERVGVSPAAAQAIAPTGQQVGTQDAAGADQYRSQYAGNPLAQGFNYGTQAAMALPALESGAGAIRAGGNALMRGAGDFVTGNAAGNLLTRGASLATGGALSGAGAAAVTAAGSPQPLGQQMASGAEGGAVAGPVLGAAGAAINHALGGAGIDPYVAQLAQKAVDMGIPLRAGQIATNPMIRVADDVVSRVPGSGSGSQGAAQVEAFNRNVAGEMGENATRITPALMQQAKTRIGGVLNDVAAKTTIQGDAPLAQDLTAIHRQASNVLPQSELTPIENQINNVSDAFNNNDGKIGGDVYQALTRTGSPLDRAMQSNDSNVRFYAGQVRDALDAAMQRSASPELQQQLSTARYQYKVMKTIEPLVAKDTDGLISPAALMTPVTQHFGNIAYNGGGKMGDLARIGQQFLKTPSNSNTADRAAMIGALGVGVPSLAIDALHSPVQAGIGLASTLGGIASARAAHMALNNASVRNALIARALGRTSGPAINALTAAAAQPAGYGIRSATGQQ